jgi:hypothetical protein
LSDDAIRLQQLGELGVELVVAAANEAASAWQQVPRLVSRQRLIAVNLAAAALVPKGGFWLVLTPSFVIVREA